MLAPYAQGALVWNRISYDAGPLGEDSESDTNGLLVLGFGMIFNSRFSLGPAVWIPISEDDGDTVFGINLAFAVGGQR